MQKQIEKKMLRNFCIYFIGFGVGKIIYSWMFEKIDYFDRSLSLNDLDAFTAV